VHSALLEIIQAMASTHILHKVSTWSVLSLIFPWLSLSKIQRKLHYLAIFSNSLIDNQESTFLYTVTVRSIFIFGQLSPLSPALHCMAMPYPAR
jgi:hypothetical protein